MNNYHTHTSLCHHAEGKVLDYTREAQLQGIHILGMSDHAPLPDSKWPGVRMTLAELDIYEGQIQEARREVKDITILKGLECEWDPSYRNFYTEELLEEWVKTLNSDVIVRGATVEKLENSEHQASVTYSINGRNQQISSDFLIGCDGKNSFVRKSSNISFDGSSYPDTYVMGDFDDNTAFGKDAAVFLHRDGLVESFPLPNGQRRWVVKTDSFNKDPEKSQLIEQIFKRTHLHLGNCKNYMLSSFGVQHLLADAFHKNRFLLAGDAAHIVSPIGGQGMNLGWIDAEECLKTLMKIRQDPGSEDHHLKHYSTKQRKIAKQVAKRAEMNMRLGRKESANVWTRASLLMVLKTPLRHILARIFTMRGLGSWPV